MTPRHDGIIDDTELERLRGKLGHLVSVADPPYLTEVTRDAVRRWTVATGDHSPQFADESRAARSSLGVLAAPPCMLYAFSKLSIDYRGGLPGVHSMFGGSHWRWSDYARLGDRIKTSTVFTGLDELPSRFAYLEQTVPDHGWLVGDSMTLADLSVASVLRSLRYVEREPSADSYPRLDAWYARVRDSACWQKVAAVEDAPRQKKAG